MWIAVTAATHHNVKSAHQCSMVLSCCLLRGSTFCSCTAPEHWRADFTLWRVAAVTAIHTLWQLVLLFGCSYFQNADFTLWFLVSGRFTQHVNLVTTYFTALWTGNVSRYGLLRLIALPVRWFHTFENSYTHHSSYFHTYTNTETPKGKPRVLR